MFRRCKFDQAFCAYFAFALSHPDISAYFKNSDYGPVAILSYFPSLSIGTPNPDMSIENVITKAIRADGILYLFLTLTILTKAANSPHTELPSNDPTVLLKSAKTHCIAYLDISRARYTNDQTTLEVQGHLSLNVLFTP